MFKATAEQLPLENACFDGAICQVMISYTQEDRVVKEISRVLKPGAVFYLFSHGSGYYVRYLLCGHNWKIRLYGLRTLINTLFWILFGNDLFYFRFEEQANSSQDIRIIINNQDGTIFQ